MMKSYVVKTPNFIKFLFKNWAWNFSTKKKVLYLTFDDGPTPEVTEWTLKQLEKYNAKATFFCLGKNIAAHPEIFKKIIQKGHAYGNHTFNHCNGWRTSTKDYLNDFAEFQKILASIDSDIKVQKSFLFRPPYGKLSLAQSKAIRSLGSKILMWDVLSADFDAKITAKESLDNVIQNSKNGSIIVFHDSLKASEKLQYVLPKVLEYYTEKGYVFKEINYKPTTNNEQQITDNR